MSLPKNYYLLPRTAPGVTCMNVLLIGTWGFPGNWYRAKYRPAIPPDNTRWNKISEWKISEEYKTTHSTTVALASTLLDQGHDVHVRIYGLDTLASISLPSIKGDRQFRNILEKILDEYSENDPTSYQEIVRRAKKILDLYADKYFSELIDTQRLVLNTNILPGIGSFQLASGKDGLKKKYVFKGSPLNTALALEHDLFSYLRENTGINAVILDISHGINYLPAISLEVVQRAITAYSALYRKEVFFTIVNSDPVRQEGQEALIHTFRATRIKGSIREILDEAIHSPSDEHVFKMIKNVKPSKELMDLRDVVKKIRNNYLSYAKAIHLGTEYGLVLYIMTLLHEIDREEISDYQFELLGLIKKIIGSRKIEKNGNTIEISYDFEIRYNIVLDTFYMLKILEEINNPLGENSLKKNIKYSKSVCPVMFSIRELKRSAEALDLSPVGNLIFSEEMKSLREDLERMKYIVEQSQWINRPVLYKVIYKMCHLYHCAEDLEETINNKFSIRDKLTRITDIVFQKLVSLNEKECEINHRNFFAHAGMEKNTVYVIVPRKQYVDKTDINEDTVFIGYRKECIDKIKEIIKERLK